MAVAKKLFKAHLIPCPLTAKTLFGDRTKPGHVDLII
jgi:hypothetical protein